MKNRSEPDLIHYPPSIHECTIRDVAELTSNIFRIRFESESISNHSRPGQFINIKVSHDLNPLWRRPFSIHDVNHGENVVDILFKVIGQGTESMSQMQAAQNLNFIGPLGNSFDLPEDGVENAIIIAGGIGIAPFMLLCRLLKEKNASVHLFWGGRDESDFYLLEEFKRMGAILHLSTDDGSVGYKGFVTSLFEKEMQDVLKSDVKNMIYACGPNPMLHGISEIAKRIDVPCQISLETLMACGLGACLGCGVKRRKEEISYYYVCKDGPVFYSDEVDLSE